MATPEPASLSDVLSVVGDGLTAFAVNIGLSFYNFAWALFHPGYWADWLIWTNTMEDKLSLARFIFFGGSVEFFFFVLRPPQEYWPD
ncbi:MAG: hypothetical protein AAGH73_01845 [Pseudomonadota bacterium]